MQFHNYRGTLVDAPADLGTLIIDYDSGLIAWSRNGATHQIRYGLQVVTFTDSLLACEAFGHALHHNLQCDGLLDD